MCEEVGVLAPGVFEGVGEDGEPGVVEVAAGKLALGVSGLVAREANMATGDGTLAIFEMPCAEGKTGSRWPRWSRWSWPSVDHLRRL
jgi:hypothetical protein